MQRQSDVSKPSSVSRRKLVKVATALAATAVGAQFASEPAEAMPANGCVNPPEQDSYRVMALFVFFLSPTALFGTMTDDSKVASMLGFTQADAKSRIAAFRKQAKTKSWQDVRDDIFNLLKDSTTTVYTGTQCPKTLDPVKYIADISN